VKLQIAVTVSQPSQVARLEQVSARVGKGLDQ
jgi:hypothetical protein